VVEEARKPGPVPERSYPRPGDDHSSRIAIADDLKQPTREFRTDRPQTFLYLVLLRMGFTWPPTSPLQPVSSYLTLSPLPDTKKLHRAVFSLWHYPWGHPRSPLGTILSCGARTFLPLITKINRRSS